MTRGMFHVKHPSLDTIHNNAQMDYRLILNIIFQKGESKGFFVPCPLYEVV